MSGDLFHPGYIIHLFSIMIILSRFRRGSWIPADIGRETGNPGPTYRKSLPSRMVQGRKGRQGWMSDSTPHTDLIVCSINYSECEIELIVLCSLWESVDVRGGAPQIRPSSVLNSAVVFSFLLTSSWKYCESHRNNHNAICLLQMGGCWVMNLINSVWMGLVLYSTVHNEWSQPQV